MLTPVKSAHAFRSHVGICVHTRSLLHCLFLFLINPHVAGRLIIRGRSGRRHDAVLHGVRGPRGENRGQVLQAVPQDDGPHDLGGAGAGEAVDPVRDATRGEGGGQGPCGVTGPCPSVF